MQRFFAALRKNALFRGLEEEEIYELLCNFGAYKKDFDKNELVRAAETCVNEIGLVVQGVVYVTKLDYNGNRTILDERKIGGSFGETLAFTKAENSPISIIAAKKDTTIIFLPLEKIIGSFKDSCKICYNFVIMLAEKAATLQIKNDILSQKTTREKLLLYFEYQSKTANSKTFRIDFSRSELADFLCLNSSAMSRELGKMRDEGILTFRKNRFVLKN